MCGKTVDSSQPVMTPAIPGFALGADKNIAPHELAELFVAVGWGEPADYPPEAIARSLGAYPLIVHCRDTDGRLVGYVSAFTDGTFSTVIGELAVHPRCRRQGIGSALLAAIVERCPGTPVYGMPFANALGFFLARGFRMPKREMAVVSLRNVAAP